MSQYTTNKAHAKGLEFCCLFVLLGFLLTNFDHFPGTEISQADLASKEA